MAGGSAAHHLEVTGGATKRCEVAFTRTVTRCGRLLSEAAPWTLRGHWGESDDRARLPEFGATRDPGLLSDGSRRGWRTRCSTTSKSGTTENAVIVSSCGSAR